MDVEFSRCLQGHSDVDFQCEAVFCLVIYLYTVYIVKVMYGVRNFWLCFCIENYSDLMSFVLNLLQSTFSVDCGTN